MASIWYDGRRYPLATQHIPTIREQILENATTGNAFWLDVYGPSSPKPIYLLIAPGVPLAVHDWEDAKDQTWIH